jgi:hypothetical protein
MLVFICFSLGFMNSYAYYKARGEYEDKMRQQAKRAGYKQKVERDSPEAKEYK